MNRRERTIMLIVIVIITDKASKWLSKILNCLWICGLVNVLSFFRLFRRRCRNKVCREKIEENTRATPLKHKKSLYEKNVCVFYSYLSFHCPPVCVYKFSFFLPFQIQRDFFLRIWNEIIWNEYSKRMGEDSNFFFTLDEGTYTYWFSI